MSKVLSVKIEEELLQKLEKVAKAKGVSKSFLVKKGVGLILKKKPQELENDLLRKITEALKMDSHLPVSADWKVVEKELATTTSPWRSLKEAMKASRKRKWDE